MDFPKTLSKILYLALLNAFSWGSPVLASSWHEDGEAGVRVRLPFPPALVKTGRQIEALIREVEPEAIAEGVSYTSGVYAEDGLPYFLIWKRTDSALPSYQDVLALSQSADAGRSFGLEGVSFDPQRMLGRGVGIRSSEGSSSEGAPLERRVLFQLARGETVFLAYYFSRPEHAPYFEELAASLELAPDKRVRVEELTGYGRLSRQQMMLWAGGVGLVFLAGVFWTAMRQSHRRAQAVWLSMNLAATTRTTKPEAKPAELA